MSCSQALVTADTRDTGTGDQAVRGTYAPMRSLHHEVFSHTKQIKHFVTSNQHSALITLTLLTIVTKILSCLIFLLHILYLIILYLVSCELRLPPRHFIIGNQQSAKYFRGAKYKEIILRPFCWITHVLLPCWHISAAWFTGGAEEPTITSLSRGYKHKQL